jgi:hypothetical protein
MASGVELNCCALANGMLNLTLAYKKRNAGNTVTEDSKKWFLRKEGHVRSFALYGLLAKRALTADLSFLVQDRRTLNQR